MEINEEIVNLDSPISLKKKDEFRDLLIESIEEVLSFSLVVLNFLELNTAFKKDNILEDPMIFSRELEDLFGASAKGIEDLIIERLCKKTKQKYRKDRSNDFEKCVSESLECFLEHF